MIKVYWQAARRGQNLMLSNDDTGREQSIGGFRENAQGFDAYVTTAEYDPRNSKNGLPNIAKAKAFVESSRPRDLYGAQGAGVEPEVRPASANAEPTDEPPAAAGSNCTGTRPTILAPVSQQAVLGILEIRKSPESSGGFWYR